MSTVNCFPTYISHCLQSRYKNRKQGSDKRPERIPVAILDMTINRTIRGAYRMSDFVCSFRDVQSRYWLNHISSSPRRTLFVLRSPELIKNVTCSSKHLYIYPLLTHIIPRNIQVWVLPIIITWYRDCCP